LVSQFCVTLKVGNEKETLVPVRTSMCHRFLLGVTSRYRISDVRRGVLAQNEKIIGELMKCPLTGNGM